MPLLGNQEIVLFKMIYRSTFFLTCVNFVGKDSKAFYYLLSSSISAWFEIFL